MSIATAITNAQNKVAAAYSSVNTMGGTMPATQNLSNLPTAIESIPSGGSGGKYKLLDRVKDDVFTEIGTVSGFFIDANNDEYAVVCLDARYRLASGAYCSNTSSAITNLPTYKSWSLWSSKNTSTFNTQKILDFCTAQSATSTACSHCRNQIFSIDDIIYYGQLPNIMELRDICENYVEIESKDSSSSQYASLRFPRTSDRIWSSTQFNAGNSWYLLPNGGISAGSKNTSYFICPVLEIPNK